MDFKCKCGSTSVDYYKFGQHIGVYCSKCGKRII